MPTAPRTGPRSQSGSQRVSTHPATISAQVMTASWSTSSPTSHGST